MSLKPSFSICRGSFNKPGLFGLAKHRVFDLYTATISQIDRKVETRSETGNTVLVRAQFDKESFPKELLREGTRVTARVHCGQRPVGYVLFRDVIETVQQKVLFWF